MSSSQGDDDILLDEDEDGDEVTEELGDVLTQRSQSQPSAIATRQHVNNNVANVVLPGHNHHQHHPRHLPYGDPWQACEGHNTMRMLPPGAGTCHPLGSHGPVPPQIMAFMNNKNDNNNSSNVGSSDGDNNSKKKVKKNDSSHTATKFTDHEKDALTDIIGEILPIGNPCWAKVESSCNSVFPTRRRHLENLRKQFNTLAKTTMPTGNPNCPSYVRAAKRIKDEIYGKSCAMTMGGEDDDEDFDLVGPPMNQLALENDMDNEGNNEGNKKNGSGSGYETATSNLTNTASSEGAAVVTTPGTGTRPPRGGSKDQAIHGLVSAFLAAEQTRRADLAKQDEIERRRERRREKREDRKFKLMMAMTMSNSSGGGRGGGILLEDDNSSSSSSAELKRKRKKHKRGDDSSENSDEHCGSDASTCSKKAHKQAKK